MHITPRPMSRHRAILVRLLILRFRRKMIGRAAHMRSVIIERTIAGDQ